MVVIADIVVFKVDNVALSIAVVFIAGAHLSTPPPRLAQSGNFVSSK